VGASSDTAVGAANASSNRYKIDVHSTREIVEDAVRQDSLR
jgi:hypothetical protein